MRQIVSPLSGIQSPFGVLTSVAALSVYAVNNFDPSLVFDFGEDYYRTSGSASTFSDSITHSASSNATMVDSDGLLKWRPHNFLTYSEQFDNAAWIKSNASVAANAAVAPDGTTTADKVIATAVDAGHFVYTNSTGSWENGVVSVYAKAGEYTNLRIMEIGSYHYRASFDLETGVISNSGGTFFISASAVDVGDGWYLCSITTNKTNSGAFSVMGFPDGSEPTTTPATYLGDGTSGIYIWGAHAYRSDLGGMVNNPDRGDSYVPTTSEKVYLPRRGHHVYNGDSWVNKGLLHESEARTNLVTDSNNLTGANNVVETLNSGTSPSGENDAVLISNSAAGASSFHYYSQSVSLTQSTTYTLSCYVKHQAGSGWVWLLGETTTNQFAYFNVQSGTVGTTANFDSVSMEDIGNNWYRISATFTKTSASSTEEVGIGLTIADNTKNWDSTGVANQEQVLVYGFQLEAASTPSSYIPTSGATVTRSAETLTVPAANLPWPSPVVIGEELVTNGTFDTDSDWTKGTGWTIGGGVANHAAGAASSLEQASILTPGTVYQVTVDATASGGTWALQFVGGTTTTVGSSLGSGSYSFVGVAGPSNTTLRVFAGSATDLIVDNISVKEINPLSVSIQMQGEMTYADTGNTELTFFDWRVNSGNYIQANLRTQTTATGEVYHIQAAASVADDVDGRSSQYTPGVNVPFNIASRHGSTFINGAVDGTALTADPTPVALPDLSATDLQLGYDFNGTISLLRIWSDDIGDTGIAEASAPSTVPSLSLTFDGASTSFTDSGMVV